MAITTPSSGIRFTSEFNKMASIARTPKKDWQLPYAPRQYFTDFHQRPNRNAFMICHRRSGKTVAAVAEMVIRAVYTKKKNAQYFYICPFRSQAKAVAWQYLVDMTEGLATEVKVSELSVKLPNNAKIFLTGSDNVNALRGLYADGVVLDEFAQCRPDLLQAVVMPLLLDRQGWLLIIGTAYGRLNQFYEYYERARDSENWFFRDLKVHDTKIIPEKDLEDIKLSISEAKFKQEFLNDFSAELTGTYYASLINDAEQQGRLVAPKTPGGLYSPELQVSASFDIGRGDATVIWFWQENTEGIVVIDYYSNNGEPAGHYIDHLKSKPYDYKKIWLPHDARAKTFSTNRSALEQFMDAQLPVDIVPMLSVEDGIEAARQMLPHCTFDYDKCYEGVECLRVYRKAWSEANQCFSNTPHHDFSSHASDSLRYMSIVAVHRKKRKAPDPITEISTNGRLATYNLDKLYADREKPQRTFNKMRI